MAEPAETTPQGLDPREARFLMIACFIALVTTSFAFIIRVLCMDAWQVYFGLSETQKGEIFGAGMWPFGLTIVLFSLIVDKVGYGRSMIVAFLCHFVSAILLLSARGYWWLYAGSILNGLAAGTVEAVINPAIASAYPKRKTTMLTILHAGWPGGMVIGGGLILLLGLSWKVSVAIILIPVVLYGIMILKAKFPVSERVLAGVSYRDMLRELGAIGCLLVVYLICMELNRVFIGENLTHTGFIDLPSLPLTIVIAVVTLAFFAYTRSLGRPMYILLLFVMILLATTELGVDTWVSDLMKQPMAKLALPGGLVLIYMQVIMMVLRFCIAPIERALKPLGVLFVCACVAAVGLYALSQAAGIVIFVAATVYGAGKAFFWPVTLGLVSERFPRGGALTLNAMGGVGMLGVGIIGSQILGFWQDNRIDHMLAKENPALHAQLMAKEEKRSVFGHYKALDQKKVSELRDKIALYDYRQKRAKEVGADKLEAELAKDDMYRTLVRNAYDHICRKPEDTAEKTFDEMVKALKDAGAFVDEATYKTLVEKMKTLDEVIGNAKRSALTRVPILPAIMAVVYLCLILYFRATGGYKAVELLAEGQQAQPAGGEAPEAPAPEEQPQEGQEGENT